MDFATSKTADVWRVRSDLGDINNDLIADTKLNHGAGLEAQVWRGNNRDDDGAMWLSDGVHGERGVEDWHTKSVKLAGRRMH